MFGVEAGVGFAVGCVFGAYDYVDVVGNFELDGELVKACSAFIAYEDGEDVKNTEFGECFTISDVRGSSQRPSVRRCMDSSRVRPMVWRTCRGVGAA